MKIKLHMLLMAAITLYSSSAYSKFTTYNGSTWSNGAPGNNDNVTFTGGSYTLSANATYSSLTLSGGSFSIGGHTFIVNNNITLNSGTLYMGGTAMTVSGNINLNGGTLDMGGASFTPGNNISVTANSNIVSTNTSRLDASGHLLTINGGTLTIDNAEVVIDDLTFLTNHDINASNDGFLSFDNSAQHQINGSNSGTVTNSAHVNAKVRLYTKNGNSGIFYFPIGDGTVYSPYIFTPSSVTGNTDFGQWIEVTYTGSIASTKALDLSTLNSTSGYEYWTVATSGSTVIGTMALRFDNNNTKTGKSILNSISNANTDLLIAQLVNSKWSGLASSNLTTSNITTVSSVSTLSPNTLFTLASNNSRTRFVVPLPVTLLNFNATVNNANKTVELKWETTKEENSKHFEVLHSSDFITWNVIGVVKSNGSKNGISSYSFFDLHPSAINNYKLKEVAENGDITFSDIKPANLSASSDARVNLYPNPASESVTLNCENVDMSGVSSIQLVNQLGQVVLEKRIEDSFSNTLNTTINVSDLAPGIYHIRIAGTISEKIIITR